MTPYETIERLIGKYGVANVLLMIKDIANITEEHLDRLGDAPIHARAWGKTVKIIGNAVRDLPKASGIK